MHWFYALNNQRRGPVTQGEFERLAEAGVLTPQTLVWRQGMAGWRTLGDVLAEDPGVLPAPRPPPLPGEAAPAPAAQPAAQGAVLRYAGFLPRVAARFVDYVILSFANEILFRVLGAAGLVHEVKFDTPADLLRPEIAAGLWQLSLIGLLVALAYEIFFIRRFSATPGKLALGLRLVRSDGSRLSAGRIIGRHFADLLNHFTFGLSYLLVAIDSDQRRGLHDHLADTRVVRKND
ncbi:MAG: RDD family protein [Opitutaceae bacterium]|jgi:uncharacterized RDD family membrane protein YckC|nr:RDD family protein [Opitutaceae bacterium]